MPSPMGDIAGAVRCAAAGDHRDGECPANLEKQANQSATAVQKIAASGEKRQAQYFFHRKEGPAGYRVSKYYNK